MTAGWPFWIRWTAATAASSGVVFLLPGWVAALLYGAILGTLQWLVLRPRLSRAGWWIAASIAGWPLGLAASYLLHFAARKVVPGAHLPIAVYSAAAAAAVGVVQWLVLRRELSRAAWWIVANVAAWALAFALGYGLIQRGMLPAALAGALSGAIGGALTGAVMVGLFRGQKSSLKLGT